MAQKSPFYLGQYYLLMPFVVKSLVRTDAGRLQTCPQAGLATPTTVSASRPSRRLVVGVAPGRRSPVCVRHAQAGGAGTTLQLPTGGEFETSGGYPASNLAVKQDGL